MPAVTGKSTKVFVGNLTNQVTSEVIRKLFEDYGEVSECDVLKNYGFVHMDSEENAEKAIEALNGYDVMGQKIVVEASTGSGGKRDTTTSGSMHGIRRGGTKIFVGNLPIQATPEFLRKQFSEFGTVMECDILKNYGFIHLDTPENAQRAVDALHGSDIFGQKMTVEASTSDVRRNPGMGGANRCFRCGSGGHWSKDCPDGPPGDRRRFAGGAGPMRPSARSMDFHRGPYPHARDRYDVYDRYDPYSRYDDRYASRRLPPPPPPLPPRRSPDPRDYYGHPPRRDYSPERRFGERRLPPPPPPPPPLGADHRDSYYLPSRRDERDPYAAAVPRDHYTSRDHYLPPPPGSDYRRDYPPAPPKEYSRRYAPLPPREYSPPGSGRYLHPAPPREMPRAYGGIGGRMSPPMASRRV